MTKHYAELGFIFVVEGKRSSNPSTNTLIAYAYKHHGDLAIDATFDLDEHNQMIEDWGNPIAKIDWRGNAIVRVLNKAEYNSLSDEVKASIEGIFCDYLVEHTGK